MTPPRPRPAKLSDALRAACFLATLFLAAHPASAAPPTTRPAASTRPTDPDLIAWWRADAVADNVAQDLSGHHHDARPADGKIIVETVADRLCFRTGNGARELIAGADPAFDFTADFSIALRVRLRYEQNNVIFLSKRTPGGTDGYALAHGIGEVGGVGFIAAPKVVVPTPAKAVDAWLHVVVAFHDRDFTLYVDGKAIAVSELPATPVASDKPLVLGASAGGKNPVDGWLDDIRIYRRGLTAPEAEALAAGKEPDNPYTKLSATEDAQARKLVAQLGSDTYATRESAARQLKSMGRKIFPLLREYRDSEDIEISSRVKSLLGELPKSETEK